MRDQHPQSETPTFFLRGHPQSGTPTFFASSGLAPKVGHPPFAYPACRVDQFNNQFETPTFFRKFEQPHGADGVPSNWWVSRIRQPVNER